MNKDIIDKPKIIELEEEPINNLDNKVNTFKQNDLKDNKKVILIILSVIIIIFITIIFSVNNDNLSVFYGDYDSEYGSSDKKNAKDNSSNSKTTLKNSIKKSLSSSKIKSTTSKNPSNNDSTVDSLDDNNSSYEEDIFDDNFDNSTSSLPDLEKPDPPEYPNIEDDEVDFGDIGNANNLLIEKILKDYGVGIKFNNKIDKYFDKYVLIKYLDDKKINQMLVEIDRELSKYPVNFFREFNIRGLVKPLNLVLVDKIDYISLENNRLAVGIVDVDYNDEISIIYRYVGGNFNKNIHYYMMYVIDYYININYNFQNVYNYFLNLNPINFNYGNINSSLSYKNNKKGYFLSDFSQQNKFFDRASIFSVMMTDTRQNNYFNRGENIRNKLDSIIFTISNYFLSANGFKDVNSWNNKLN